MDDFLGCRIVDVSTKLLLLQPLEPSRALANRMYNERTLLQTAAAQAPQPPPSLPSVSAPSAQAKEKGGRAREAAKPVQRQAALAPSVEGSVFRQWTQPCLMPFGLEALSSFQLPAVALATGLPTSEMLATVVALLYRQCRCTANERKVLPQPIAPLFYDSAEEVDVAVVVPFLLALAEQELRGVAPGFTTRVTLTCILISLRALGLEVQRERAATPKSSLASSMVCTFSASSGTDSGVEEKRRPANLSAKVARVGSVTETYQLGQHLCKCVNRGLVASRRRVCRSGKSSLSSSARTSSTIEGCRHSQSRGLPGHDRSPTDSRHTDDIPAPLSAADLDDLVDSLFCPPDGPTSAATTAVVSANGLHRALFALTVTLWSVYEVAIPLAALFSARTGNSSATTTVPAVTAKGEFTSILEALSLHLEGSKADANLDPAEAMIVEDFGKVLKSIATHFNKSKGTTEDRDAGGSASLSLTSFCPVPSDLSAFQKGHSIRSQGCSPAVSSLWLQAFDWALQVAESVIMAEYQKEPM